MKSLARLPGAGCSNRCRSRRSKSVATNPQGSLGYRTGIAVEVVTAKTDIGRAQPMAGSTTYLPMRCMKSVSATPTANFSAAGGVGTSGVVKNIRMIEVMFRYAPALPWLRSGWTKISI